MNTDLGVRRGCQIGAVSVISPLIHRSWRGPSDTMGVASLPRTDVKISGDLEKGFFINEYVSASIL